MNVVRRHWGFVHGRLWAAVLLVCLAACSHHSLARDAEPQVNEITRRSVELVREVTEQKSLSEPSLEAYRRALADGRAFLQRYAHEQGNAAYRALEKWLEAHEGFAERCAQLAEQRDKEEWEAAQTQLVTELNRLLREAAEVRAVLARESKAH